MPGINVSALSGGDLRRLLKVAHARRDGLLADRLEWEIAARATSGGRPSVSFASHQDDDEDEPVERMAAPEAEADPEAVAPEYTAKAPRGVVLVTLGALAGSLLSAAVFWGLERMDMRQPFVRAEPQATPAIAPAAPVAEQLVAELTPAPLPPSAEPIAPEAAPAAMVETALAVAAPPAEVARKPAPARVAQKKHAAPAKTLTVAKAEGPPRPPTLSEWLKTEPEEPIF